MQLCCTYIYYIRDRQVLNVGFDPIHHASLIYSPFVPYSSQGHAGHDKLKGVMGKLGSPAAQIFTGTLFAHIPKKLRPLAKIDTIKKFAVLYHASLFKPYSIQYRSHSSPSLRLIQLISDSMFFVPRDRH
jgi:hypothetical protein